MHFTSLLFASGKTLSAKRKQHGAILLFCLLFLMLLTMTATVSMEAAIVELRSSGRMQDYQVALQATEAALDVAEEWLAVQVALPPIRADSTTIIWQRDVLDPDTMDSLPWWQDPARQQSWWRDNAVLVLGMKGLSEPPRYIIEQLAVDDKGAAGEVVRVVYRITARGSGRGGWSSVTLQSIRIGHYQPGMRGV